MSFGGVPTLKKSKPKVPWIELNFSPDSKHWKKSPTVRMREVDSFRLHVPSPEERDILKIPESSDRLMIQDNMNSMILCGGYAGVHFTSEVLFFVTKISV